VLVSDLVDGMLMVVMRCLRAWAAGKQAHAAAVRACMRISWPVLQIGHRRNRSSEAESRLPGESALASLTACEAPSKDRHSASFSFRLRLAKNPKWRM